MTLEQNRDGKHCPTCKKGILHTTTAYENLKDDKVVSGVKGYSMRYYKCDSCGVEINDAGINVGAGASADIKKPD
jgi:DNA-directed RNA polymerase subunit RPC12/RpoP